MVATIQTKHFPGSKLHRTYSWVQIPICILELTNDWFSEHTTTILNSMIQMQCFWSQHFKIFVLFLLFLLEAFHYRLYYTILCITAGIYSLLHKSVPNKNWRKVWFYMQAHIAAFCAMVTCDHSNSAIKLNAHGNIAQIGTQKVSGFYLPCWDFWDKWLEAKIIYTNYLPGLPQQVYAILFSRVYSSKYSN